MTTIMTACTVGWKQALRGDLGGMFSWSTLGSIITIQQILTSVECCRPALPTHDDSIAAEDGVYRLDNAPRHKPGIFQVMLLPLNSSDINLIEHHLEKQNLAQCAGIGG